jgi:putative Holliday junction resolvase
MRLLGLDIGEKRVGLAVSDPTGTVATPLKVLDADALKAGAAQLKALVDEYEVAGLVVGLPLGLDGEEGPQARLVRTAGVGLSRDLDLPVEFRDERLTSVAARRSMRESGVAAREARGSVDMVAAALLLQGYLDARNDGASE